MAALSGRLAIGLLALGLCAGASCSVQSPFGSAGDRPAELAVVAHPATARVYVNDRFVATARRLSRRPHTLRPGVCFVTVRAPGHFPHDLRLDLPAGRTTVEIRLRPIPP